MLGDLYFCAEEMDLYPIAKPCLKHCEFSLPICLIDISIYKLLFGQTSSQPPYSSPLQTVAVNQAVFGTPIQNTKPARE